MYHRLSPWLELWIDRKWSLHCCFCRHLIPMPTVALTSFCRLQHHLLISFAYQARLRWGWDDAQTRWKRIDIVTVQDITFAFNGSTFNTFDNASLKRKSSTKYLLGKWHSNRWSNHWKTCFKCWVGFCVRDVCLYECALMLVASDCDAHLWY